LVPCSPLPPPHNPAPLTHPLQAAEKLAAEDAELAARLAYEAKCEFEAEEAQRKAEKEALKTFLLK
jgi:hypothetical protein